MKDSEITSYLHRVNLQNCNPTLQGLNHLQEHHTQIIPFENLDIIVGRKILLDYTHLFDKIILKNRGGYCFEFNTLYAELLKTIGFKPKPVLGRVWISNPKKIPPRNHLAHIVELEGRSYITDVGYGGLITRIPLDIHNSTPVHDKDGWMRIIPISNDQFMIQRQDEEIWTDQYSFETLEISEEDIQIANHYMSTHTNSHFYYHKFVGKNTVNGRIGLFNNKMTIRKGIKIIDVKQVEYGTEWIETIKAQFSINLDFTEEELNSLFSN